MTTMSIVIVPPEIVHPEPVRASDLELDDYPLLFDGFGWSPDDDRGEDGDGAEHLPG